MWSPLLSLLGCAILRLDRGSSESVEGEVVSISDIESAERLVGIAYTAAEREQMIGNLEGQIAAAIARRKFRFDNSMPTASRFDPRLPNFRMPAPGSPRFSRAAVRPLPEDEADIAFASIGELAAWIGVGALTSRRLTEIYLSRIDALGPRLECFATVTAKRALAEADAADALMRGGVNLGPLHGLPYGLKDLFDTKEITTGWGAELHRGRVPASDATIVRKLRAAGAVLLGKTTVGALAYNDIWYGGWTRNPWNLNEGSSGSSAGSASATATGLCAFSIGTETLGSITSPSQRCGTTGLRPTFGRVSRGGGMALCWSLDKVGAICRFVEDTGVVLAAINGADGADRFSIEAPFRFDAEAGISGLKLGYLPEAFGEGATEVDHAALAASRRLGIEVVEVSLPPLPYETLMNVVYAEAAAAFEDLTLSDLDDTLKWQDDGAWPNTFRKARFLSAVDHVQLDRLRYQVMLALDELFGKVDAVIGPFMTGPMLIASNFTGHPCLHLRAGFLEVATRGAASLGSGKLTTGEPEAAGRTFKVPQGVSLWGRLFEEGPILNLGMALEKELGVAAVRPEFPV
jgi:Asp-tRNA(Asn)/Glu-tRNA(Gln) amidotransferase A subunit family amidase